MSCVFGQSLYTIPAAWVLSIAPHFYSISLGGKQFDNKNPRAYVQSLEKNQTLDNGMSLWFNHVIHPRRELPSSEATL